MSESLDPQIVEAIRSGEPGAFAKLVRKYQGAVHGYAYHLTQDASAAEEIAQETFLEAYLHIHSLRDPQKLGSWLRSLTYHHSMNWFRHHRETTPLMDVLPTDQPIYGHPAGYCRSRPQMMERIPDTKQTGVIRHGNNLGFTRRTQIVSHTGQSESRSAYPSAKAYAWLPLLFIAFAQPLIADGSSRGYLHFRPASVQN